MGDLGRFQAADREAWRAWLKRHHAKSRGVWLVYWKKSVGKPSIAYEHSVEEALCFGWIDGQKRSIDAERYAHRFTPRRKSSQWSPSNLSRVEKLIGAGLMHPTGLALARAALKDAQKRPAQSKKPPSTRLPADFSSALSQSPIARTNFETFAPGYRRRYLAWIADAKRPETRKKRVREAVDLIARNVKVLMK